MIITAANTVSRARVEVSEPPDNHQGDDQRHLDDGDGDGEHQRPERFADPVSDHLGMMDGGEDRGGQQDAQQRQHGHRGLRPHVAISTTAASTGTTPVHRSFPSWSRMPIADIILPRCGRRMPIGEAIRARSLRRGATYRRLSSVMSWRSAQALALGAAPGCG